MTVLEVRDLRTYLYTRWGVTRAVDGVSFELNEGETLGIVGESGCGKSMLALSLMRLTPQPIARTVSGEILLNGDDLLRKSERQMEQVRGRLISMILQDPQTSLNPVFTIGNQLIEAITYHQPGPVRDGKAQAIQALRMVGVAAPEERLRSYPHQMSGGQKQRVVGAMAISGHPSVLIADEPTTALDATVQAQYLQLIKRLQAETGVSILFISHDFGVIARMCDRVAVMYAGRLVEQGPVKEILERPAHPYTQALIASVPSLDNDIEELPSIEGQPPALYALTPGCRFAPRCSRAFNRCGEYPPDFWVADHRTAACWLLEPER